ncbi:right-handed parallel beta-helix repeat-containing protein [Nitrospira sp. Nam74]
MTDTQYFSKLRGFLSGRGRRKTPRPGARRSSAFSVESLEARVLLSADLAGAISVADIIKSTTFGQQPAVVQNVQNVQTAPASTATTTSSGTSGTINLARATRDSGNAYLVSQDFGTARDTPTAPTASSLRIFENGRELGPAHSLHADIENLGNGRFSYWGGSNGTAMNLFFSASDNTNPMTNGRTYTYQVGTATAPAPSPTPTPAPAPSPTPTGVSGTINVAKAMRDSGNAYLVSQDFGTARDTPTAPTASSLRIFENGRELGPAHSLHADIENLGNGRFSYWGGSNGTAMNLFFSASDNTNPMTNGRTYTYLVGTATAPAPSPTPAPSPSPDLTARTLFVSPTGSDSNDGRSANTAYRSIGKAALAARPGDIVDIRGGTYKEYVVLANSGTADKPIVFAGHPGETVIVDGSSIAPDPSATPGNMHGGLISINGDYVTIRNLEVTKSAGPGVQIYGAHDVVDGIHSHDNFGSGIHTWQATYGVIENSTVHDNFDHRPNNPTWDGDNSDGIALSGYSSHMTIRNNTVYHNSDDGIDLWDGSNNVVEGNTVYDHGYGMGGDGEGIKIGVGTGNLVQNNIAHDNRLAQFEGGDTGGNKIIGNTAYNPRWVDFNNGFSNSQPTPNVFQNNTGTKVNGMNTAIQIGNSWQA